MNRVPTLRSFQIFVYKNKNASDITQVPCGPTQASVEFYRQGATCNLAFDTVVVSPDTSDNLVTYHTGSIKPNDRVMVDWDPAITLLVEYITAATNEIHVFNDSASPVYVGRHSRLSPVSPLARVFKFSTGTSEITQPLTPSADGTGLVAGYVAEYRFDYVISVPGDPAPKRIYLDAVGSYITRA